jgi:hypothetical protein
VSGEFDGASLILLHHIDAKPGTERVTPVGCFPRADGSHPIMHPTAAHRRTRDYNLKARPEITSNS